MARVRTASVVAIHARIGADGRWSGCTEHGTSVNGYLYRRAIGHLLAAEAADAAASLAHSFEYAWDRLIAESSAGADAWVNDLEAIARHAPGSVAAAWSAFARRHRHHFRKPGWEAWRVLFQSAMDEAPDNVIRRQAEAHYADCSQRWHWLSTAGRPDAGTRALRVRMSAGRSTPIGVVALPDGGLVSWSDDRVLRVWHVPTGTCVHELRAHKSKIAGVLILDPLNVLSWSKTGACFVWDVVHGTCVVSGALGADIQGLRRLGDGSLLTWARSGELRTWSLPDLAPRVTFLASEGSVRDATEAGALVMSVVATEHSHDSVGGRATGTVVWAHHLDGTPAWRCEVAVDSPQRLVAFPTGRVLLACYRSAAWVGPDGATIVKGHAYGRLGDVLTVDDAGTVLVTGTQHRYGSGHAFLAHPDGTTRELSARHFPDHPEGHWGDIVGALRTPDGALVTISKDRTIRRWDSPGTPSRVLATPPSATPLGCLVLDADRFVTYDAEGRVSAWRHVDGGIEREGTLDAHGGDVLGATRLPKGALVTWSSDGTIAVWDTAGVTAHEAAAPTHVLDIVGAACDSEGRLSTWGTDKALVRWMPTPKLIYAAEHRIHWAVPGPNGRWLVQVLQSVHLLDAEGRVLATLPDGTWETGLFTGRSDPAILLFGTEVRGWNGDGPPSQGTRTDLVRSGRCFSAVETRDAWCWTIPVRLALKIDAHVDALEAMDPWFWDGAGRSGAFWEPMTPEVRPVSCVGDRVLTRWTVEQGRYYVLRSLSLVGDEELVFEGHTARIAGARTLASGRLLSWSEDGELRLWDPTTAVCLQTFRDGKSAITGCEELPDRRLVAWSADGGVRTWTVDPIATPEGCVRPVMDAYTAGSLLPSGRIVLTTSRMEAVVYTPGTSDARVFRCPADWDGDPEARVDGPEVVVWQHALDEVGLRTLTRLHGHTVLARGCHLLLARLLG